MNILNKLQKILKNSKGVFLKRVLLVVGGTAFAQFTNAILSPVITRIYSPEEYGVLTAYVAILGLLSLGGFKYEIAIPISKNDKTAINVLVLSITMLVLFTFTILAIVMILGNTLFNDTVLSKYIFLLPLGILFSGLYKILRQWAFRKKDFKTIAKTSVSQSIFGNSFKIIAGITGFGALGLILGNIIKDSAGIKSLFSPILKEKKYLFNSVSIKRMNWCSKRYKDFPLFNLPTHFISSMAIQLPVFFLTILYGVQIVGFYGLASTIVRLPMNLIGASVGDVFYSEAASIGRKNPKKLKRLSNKIMKKLILVAMLPLLFLVFLGPQLFSIVFGSDWYEAGIYARIISIMLFFILIFAPVSRVYEVYEKQKLRLIMDICKMFLVVVVFLVSWILRLDSYITVLLYSVVMSLIHFFIFIFAQKIMNDEIKNSST